MLSSSVFVSWHFTLNLPITCQLYSTLQQQKCQHKIKCKRYIESRCGEFSCAAFGLIFPSEGMINANKYNTILNDYFHPLESFSLVWIFFLQDDSLYPQGTKGQWTVWWAWKQCKPYTRAISLQNKYDWLVHFHQTVFMRFFNLCLSGAFDKSLNMVKTVFAFQLKWKSWHI